MKIIPIKKAFQAWIDAADEVTSVLESYDPRKPDADFGLKLRQASLKHDRAKRDVVAAYASPKTRKEMMPMFEEREAVYKLEQAELERMAASSPEERAVYSATLLSEFVGKIPGLLHATAAMSDFSDIASQRLGKATADQVTEKTTRMFDAIMRISDKLPTHGLQ